ncbi:MAG TPA: hypothetical protein PK874_02640 [Desulfobacteraceae bacterium]|nr:hypothetical protein [Desulfobacteraceae bacterium]HPJ67491.1 hypothetical protein [Desulfobacteraceae bacterium]HPQ28004.1 hypothetical protein [Desulfobacteraceae bacterium]
MKRRPYELTWIVNEIPSRRHRCILKSIECPGGLGLVRRVSGGLVRRVYGGSCLPFTSLWMVYQPMAGWLAD